MVIKNSVAFVNCIEPAGFLGGKLTVITHNFYKPHSRKRMAEPV
jgi:hypothetical protein